MPSWQMLDISSDPGHRLWKPQQKSLGCKNVATWGKGQRLCIYRDQWWNVSINFLSFNISNSLSSLIGAWIGSSSNNVFRRTLYPWGHKLFHHLYQIYRPSNLFPAGFWFFALMSKVLCPCQFPHQHANHWYSCELCAVGSDQRVLFQVVWPPSNLLICFCGFLVLYQCLLFRSLQLQCCTFLTQLQLQCISMNKPIVITCSGRLMRK